MAHPICIQIVNPNDKEAAVIIDELCVNLQERFGSDGRNSFTDWKIDDSKYVFVIALIENKVVGCGAIRPISDKIGEVKRMYAKYPGKKIGKTILNYLENKAVELDYTELVLETRVKNKEAVQFYLKSEFNIIPNYGKYADRPEAVCLGKFLNKNI